MAVEPGAYPDGVVRLRIHSDSENPLQIEFAAHEKFYSLYGHDSACVISNIRLYRAARHMFVKSKKAAKEFSKKYWTKD